jgi:hypothetical protein
MATRAMTGITYNKRLTFWQCAVCERMYTGMFAQVLARIHAHKNAVHAHGVAALNRLKSTALSRTESQIA